VDEVLCPLHPTTVDGPKARALWKGVNLALGEPVVPRSVWVFSVKLSKFLQTSYGEVVEWLFGPVPLVGIVEPSDEV